MNYQYLINEQEEEDRYVASSLLTEVLSNNKFTDINCNPTPITYSVDLTCNCINYKSDYKEFNVEIKKNNHTEYPTTLLKVDKLERMFEASKNLPLFFMVLQNEQYGYIFNCRKIDWSKIEVCNLRQKITQYNPNSGWKNIPTYKIPFTLGKKYDISKYYANYKQI